MLISTSQDVLYITVSACVAVFTFFLVWIMYYLAQISRQSNEMITDFRNKMEELDQSITVLKEKVNDSMTTFTSIGSQVATILEIVKNVSGNRKRNRRS